MAIGFSIIFPVLVGKLLQGLLAIQLSWCMVAALVANPIVVKFN